nr:hypothetical transcript [Hymenolepis microstoma]
MSSSYLVSGPVQPCRHLDLLNFRCTSKDSYSNRITNKTKQTKVGKDKEVAKTFLLKYPLSYKRITTKNMLKPGEDARTLEIDARSNQITKLK